MTQLHIRERQLEMGWQGLLVRVRDHARWTSGPLKRPGNRLQQENGPLEPQMPQVMHVPQVMFPRTKQTQMGQATLSLQVEVTVFVCEDRWWLPWDQVEVGLVQGKQKEDCSCRCS